MSSSILFIDLASNHGTLACVAEDRTVALHSIDHRIGDHELIPVLEALLKKAKWQYTDLTHIACVTGPGGFTSLRSGVTLANTLSDQLQIPLCGIHLSDVYAARVETCESHVSTINRHNDYMHACTQ